MIYFDNNSTTPLSAAVLEKMLPCFSMYYGNASSKTHALGWQADELVKIARQQVAEALGAESSEIYFTSGATEAINLAFNIMEENYANKGKHIISCLTEHKAVLDRLAAMEKKGFSVSYLPVDQQGQIDLNLLKKSIQPDTIAIAMMHANNETGVLQPIAEIGKICIDHKLLFFSDCTQSVDKIRVNVKDSFLAMACISAHKFNGPKGIGALYISRKNPRVQLLNSKIKGGHENGIRSGTLNVPGIVGLGTAISTAYLQMDERKNHLLMLRNQFENGLKNIMPVTIHGEMTERLPNTSNICLSGVKNTELIKKLPSIAFSVGSACMSAIPEPSHVLEAMHAESAFSARFSFGIQNTSEEVDDALTLIRNKFFDQI